MAGKNEQEHTCVGNLYDWRITDDGTTNPYGDCKHRGKYEVHGDWYCGIHAPVAERAWARHASLLQERSRRALQADIQSYVLRMADTDAEAAALMQRMRELP